MRTTVDNAGATLGLPFDDHQTGLVLQAVKAVATEEGRVSPDPQQVVALEEARLMLDPSLEPASLPTQMPAGMKRNLQTKARREAAMDLMIAVVLSGSSLDSGKVNLAEQAARDLGLWEVAEALEALTPNPMVIETPKASEAKQPAA